MPTVISDAMINTPIPGCVDKSDASIYSMDDDTVGRSRSFVTLTLDHVVQNQVNAQRTDV